MVVGGGELDLDSLLNRFGFVKVDLCLCHDRGDDDPLVLGV